MGKDKKVLVDVPESEAGGIVQLQPNEEPKIVPARPEDSAGQSGCQALTLRQLYDAICDKSWSLVLSATEMQEDGTQKIIAGLKGEPTEIAAMLLQIFAEQPYVFKLCEDHIKQFGFSSILDTRSVPDTHIDKKNGGIN
jgi:hypothetical protein